MFHSIKKESDYRTNLFTGQLSESELAKAMRLKNGKRFIEFEQYRPSDEPAAFFIVALAGNGRHTGWFVLQCSTNKVTTILSRRGRFGRTGEVYLLNANKVMLTDSRFVRDSTILRMKVDTGAAREALKKGSGQRIATDYRGVRVFSSFERFDIFDTSWIIIAEMDEDEAITGHYHKHQRFFQGALLRHLAARPPVDRPAPAMSTPAKRVDMDEIGRAGDGSVLTTGGVSTCTAAALIFPGRFGYLLHVSPTGEMYMTNSLTRFFLRDNYHDLLRELLATVKHYELYPSELKKLRFVIVAPHGESFRRAVGILLDHHVELANITFIYNPAARSANVFLDAAGEAVYVEWNTDGTSSWEYDSDVEDLGTILKKIINYGD